MIAKNYDCPLGVVDEAEKLVAQIEAVDIPLDFDPIQRHWEGILEDIAHRYTNLDYRLDQLAEALPHLCDDDGILCDFLTDNPTRMEGSDCPCCPERWLAEQKVRDAARQAAEEAYQTWLARKAIAKASNG